jgi:predicted metal-dependent hydrolase
MSGTHKLNTGNHEILYQLVTSQRATRMRIDVELEGIRVTVPEGHPGDPHAFVQQKSDWIRQKHEELEAFREQIPERSFEAGATFPFLDEPLSVRREDRAYSVRTAEDFVLSEPRVQSSSVKAELEHLYRREARKVFEERVEEHADRMGVEHGTIAVRDQKTRWASCSPNDTLSFNWRVIMAPEHIVSYIVIHELAHLRERNHSEAFWQFVEAHDPNCREHARWLKDNAAKLVFDPPGEV